MWDTSHWESNLRFLFFGVFFVVGDVAVDPEGEGVDDVATGEGEGVVAAEVVGGG